MKSLRILQVIEGMNIGGAEVLLVDLVRRLREEGHEVQVAYSSPGPMSSRLTEMGVPTPNIFTGMQEIHGPLEWVSVQDMAAATKVVIRLAEMAAK